MKFWTDQWSGDLPLHLAYPVLYNLATNRAAPLDSLLIRQGMGGKRSWVVCFIRVPNDWETEMEIVDDFFRFLAANLPSLDEADHMRWKLTNNGDFNIRSFYHELCGSSSIVFT